MTYSSAFNSISHIIYYKCVECKAERQKRDKNLLQKLIVYYWIWRNDGVVVLLFLFFYKNLYRDEYFMPDSHICLYVCIVSSSLSFIYYTVFTETERRKNTKRYFFFLTLRFVSFRTLAWQDAALEGFTNSVQYFSFSNAERILSAVHARIGKVCLYGQNSSYRHFYAKPMVLSSSTLAEM